MAFKTEHLNNSNDISKTGCMITNCRGQRINAIINYRT